MVGLTVHFKDSIDAMNWSQRGGGEEGLRLAISSHSPDENLRGSEVGIIGVNPRETNQPVRYYLPLNLRQIANDLAFIYDPGRHFPDLFATASDKLRIWQINGHSIHFKHEYPNIFPPFNNVDVTNIQWNRDVPRRMTALCSKGSGVVWDLEAVRPEARMQPNARNDFFINDISWCWHQVFAAGFQDGGVHIHDLRARRYDQVYNVHGHFVHRVEWNDLFPNFLGITLGGKEVVVVVDLRRPGRVAELDLKRPGRVVAVMEPHGDKAEVHSMAWDPTTGTRICTTGSDSRVAVHDISWRGRGRGDPELFADRAANTESPMLLKWSLLRPEWLAFTYGKTLELLEVQQISDNDDF